MFLAFCFELLIIILFITGIYEIKGMQYSHFLTFTLLPLFLPFIFLFFLFFYFSYAFALLCVAVVIKHAFTALSFKRKKLKNSRRIFFLGFSVLHNLFSQRWNNENKFRRIFILLWLLELQIDQLLDNDFCQIFVRFLRQSTWIC